MSVIALGAGLGTARSKGRRIGVVLAFVVAILALAVWAASVLLRPHLPSPEVITRAMRTQAALTGGKKVYVTYCAYCHDTGFGPAITRLGLSLETVHAVVRTGPAMMPAFPPSQVSDADIEAVTRFIDGEAPK